MYPELVLLGTSPLWVGLDWLISIEGTVGAGLKGCATGLFVCPAVSFGAVLKTVDSGRFEFVDGKLGLLVGCGLGALGGSGL